MPILDSHLELLSWETHVGPDIGGVTPTVYGTRLCPNSVREFYTTGPAYSDWLAAVHRPICPNTGHLALQFELAIDDSMDVQAREFDTILAIGGYKYNMSAQFNVNSGVFQIADKNGNWIDTAWKPQQFTILQWTGVRLTYAFDIVSKTCSILSAWTSNAGAFGVAAALQKVPASPTNWTDSCSLQVQLDVASAPGSFCEWMRNVQYEWS